MKKNLFLLFAFIVIISACNKDKINNTDTKVGISRVTFFPTLTLTGSAYQAVSVGSPYTDPGAKAIVAGAEVPVAVNGSVDIQSPGVYTLTYSATNADGFSASATRTVAVYSTSSDAAANDLSGDYARTSNGVIATWTKVAPGVYKVVNPGGAAGATLTVIAINPTGSTIDIPEQQASDGSITSSTDEVYNINSNPPQYSWKIVNPGYGPALRTFIKQ